jgi:hypothetical protein
MFRIISFGPVEPIGPSAKDRFLREVIHGGDKAILEVLFEFDADVTRHRASDVGEEVSIPTVRPTLPASSPHERA